MGNDQENIRRIRERNRIGVSIQESKDSEWKEIRRKMAEGSSGEPKHIPFRSSMEIWEKRYPHLIRLEPSWLYDEAIVGVVERINLTAFCYDTQSILDILQKEGFEGTCTPEEAEEYFEYNIRGSYVGENSPVFLERKVDNG